MNNLYDTDLFGWTLQQSMLLKNRELERLDLTNLIEEIEALGRSEKKALRSYLVNFFTHLLKIKYQPEKHTRSWDTSVKSSKHDIEDVLKENPSLMHIIAERIESAYKKAKTNASNETELDENVFPEKCPWSIDEIINFKVK